MILNCWLLFTAHTAHLLFKDYILDVYPILKGAQRRRAVEHKDKFWTGTGKSSFQPLGKSVNDHHNDCFALDEGMSIMESTAMCDHSLQDVFSRKSLSTVEELKGFVQSPDLMLNEYF